MLSPTGSGPRTRPVREGQSRTQRRCFAFGGVAFELLADDSARLAFEPEVWRFCDASGMAPTLAEAMCSVQSDASLPAEVRGDEVSIARDGEALQLESLQMRARLRPLGSARYAVAARIAPSAQAACALLRGVAAAIVELEGGVTLHACGLELDGVGVLFLGPSGAGKSTAARLAEAGRCFAYDHVAVFATADGPVVWGLPGGTAAAAPRSTRAHFPLRMALRVRQGTAAPAVMFHDGTEALFALRESVESAESSRDGEEARLAAVMRLSERFQLGAVTTVLERSLTPVLRDALQRSVRGTQ